jgi:hypothetical protein
MARWTESDRRFATEVWAPRLVAGERRTSAGWLREFRAAGVSRRNLYSMKAFLRSKGGADAVNGRVLVTDRDFTVYLSDDPRVVYNVYLHRLLITTLGGMKQIAHLTDRFAEVLERSADDESARLARRVARLSRNTTEEIDDLVGSVKRRWR